MAYISNVAKTRLSASGAMAAITNLKSKIYTTNFNSIQYEISNACRVKTYQFGFFIITILDFTRNDFVTGGLNFKKF